MLELSVVYVTLQVFIHLFMSACIFPCLISGVCVRRASKVTRVRSTLTTVKITTVRITPPALMESTTTHACAHQNTQVTITNEEGADVGGWHVFPLLYSYFIYFFKHRNTGLSLIMQGSCRFVS